MHSNLFMNDLDFFSGFKQAISCKYVQLGSEPLVVGGWKPFVWFSLNLGLIKVDENSVGVCGSEKWSIIEES